MRPAPASNTACLTVSRCDSGTKKHSLYISGITSLTGIVGVRKFIQRALLYRRADSLHVFLIVMQVVQGVQLSTQNFVAALQVMQVGAAEVATRVAVTAVIQWLRARLMPGIAYLDN